MGLYFLSDLEDFHLLLFRYFSVPLLLSPTPSPFFSPPITYISNHFILCPRSLRLFRFFFCLFFFNICASLWIIQFLLFCLQFCYSVTVSHLLLCIELIHSDVVYFICISYIWFFKKHLLVFLSCVLVFFWNLVFELNYNSWFNILW